MMDSALTLPATQHHRERAMHWPTVLIILAIGVGIGLRWLNLGTASLWFDEGYTAWVVSLSPGQIVHVIRADTAPPLYYLLLHGWSLIFGHSEAALRSLSAVFATASLLIFYPLAMRILGDRRAVAVAISLFAVCEMQVAFAHEARFYSMLALMAEVDLLLVLLALDGPSPWKYAALIAAWTVSLYVNNMMVVYLAALGLAWFILPGRRRWRGRLLDLAVVTAAAGLAFSPWIPTMLAQSRAIQGNFWASRPTIHDLARTVSTLAGVNFQGLGRLSQPAVEMITAGVFAAFVVMGMVRQKTARSAWALVAFGLLPILVIFVYSRVGQSIFMERAFIATTIVMPLLIALPLTLVPIMSRTRGWTSTAYVGVIILWLMPGIVSLPKNYQGHHPEQWREASRAVQQDARSRQLVVFVANEGELLYDYYARHGDYTPGIDRQGVPASFFTLDPPRTMQRVRSDGDLSALKARINRGDFDQIVLMESHAAWSDPSRRVLHFLQQRLPLLDRRDFTQIHVYRFSTGPWLTYKNSEVKGVDSATAVCYSQGGKFDDRVRGR